MEMGALTSLSGDSGYPSIFKQIKMQIDPTTYDDLSIFHREEEISIFHKLDMTRTRGGRDCLLELFNKPLSDLRAINDTQKILALILRHADRWPSSISNGTIMVMEKFYETPMDEIPRQQVFPHPIFFKLFHGPDYSLIRYSVGHFADFARGMDELVNLLHQEESPDRLRGLMQRAARLLEPEPIRSLIKTGKKLTPAETVHYGHYIRN